MSLWSRVKPESFGQVKQVSPVEGPALVSVSNPHSEQFNQQGVKRAKDLVSYMLAEQRKKFDNTILDQLSYKTLEANAKRLMQKHGGLEVKKAIKKANDISKHPYSFKLVAKLCPKIED